LTKKKIETTKHKDRKTWNGLHAATVDDDDDDDDDKVKMTIILKLEPY